MSDAMPWPNVEDHGALHSILTVGKPDPAESPKGG